MPTCRDRRWHATQVDADACTKHPNKKHFDDLSTHSRKRAPMSASSSSQSSGISEPHTTRRRKRRAASPSQSSGLSDAPPTTPLLPGPAPIASAVSEQRGNDDEDDIRQHTPSDIDPAPLAPEPLLQPDMTPTGHKVQAWLGGVHANPLPVPPNHFADGDIITTPKPDHGLVPPAPAKPSAAPPRTPAQTGEGGQDPETIRIDKIVRRIETRNEGLEEDEGSGRGTPTPGPKTVEKPLPARYDRPWYAGENAHKVARAAALAVPTGVLLSGLALYRSGRDAERFP